MVFLLLGFVAAVGVAIGGLWLGQRRLIYFPGRAVPPVEAVLPGWAEATLKTDDGLELGGWFASPGRDAAVVLVFNGNAGSRAGRAPLGAKLAAQGLGVLLWDYRGYGGNPGYPNEDGLARDARAAASFLDRHARGHPVVYFGESLGAGVAVELAVARAPAALILRSPFTSLVDTGAVHYPFLPVRTLLRDRYPSLERLGNVLVPVQVIAGDSDSIVPFDQSRRLFDAAIGRKELKVIAGADHNDAALCDGNELIDAVVSFVRAHVERHGTANGA